VSPVPTPTRHDSLTDAAMLACTASEWQGEKKQCRWCNENLTGRQKRWCSESCLLAAESGWTMVQIGQATGLSPAMVHKLVVQAERSRDNGYVTPGFVQAGGAVA
jgi:hypothetical protein